jgi:hypothetical protein
MSPGQQLQQKKTTWIDRGIIGSGWRWRELGGAGALFVYEKVGARGGGGGTRLTGEAGKGKLEQFDGDNSRG